MKHLALHVLVALAATSSATCQIKWTTDLDAAFARAKDEKRVIFVAINMDGERANAEMLAEHYRDGRLAKLSRQTVNIFCTQSKERRVSGVSVEQQHHCEVQVRERILKATPDTWVVSPQHLFLGPDGKILSSVPYRVTKGELEWMWVDAIHKIDKDFAWKLPGSAHAPRRLRYDGKPAAPAEGKKPPTKEEVDEILDGLNKDGLSGWARAREKIPILMRSDDKRAMDVAVTVLGFIQGERRARMLDGIGATSPRVWWRVVTPHVSDRLAVVRRAAVDALGALAEPKAVKVLDKASKNRKEEATIRGYILIAWASCNPKDKKLARLLAKTVRDDDEMLRSRVIIAAGKLEQRKAVTELLAKGLADGSTIVRQTSAWMVAQRRDKHLLQSVQAAAGIETDPETKELMKAADAAIGGASLEPFKDLEQHLRSLSLVRR